MKRKTTQKTLPHTYSYFIIPSSDRISASGIRLRQRERLAGFRGSVCRTDHGEHHNREHFGG